MNIKQNNKLNKKSPTKSGVISRINELESFMTGKIPKSLKSNGPFPSHMWRTLNFQFNGFQQGINPFVLKEFKLNSAFKPDSVGTPSGFNELAAIYSLYRVTEVTIRFKIVNNEPALPVMYGFIIRDEQPSASITTYPLAINSLEVAPTCGLNVVGQTTGMSVYRSPEYKIRPGSVVGNELEYLAETNYRGVVTADPPQLIWLAFVTLGATSATSLTNGLFLEIYLSLRTLFTSVKTIEA